MAPRGWRYGDPDREIFHRNPRFGHPAQKIHAYFNKLLEGEVKDCFQVSRQFDRPTEFLQVLLDIVRVNFEPRPPGTLLLNANMGFLYESIPSEPFRLGYISIVGEKNEPFGQFYSGSVVPYLERFGYTLDKISATFATISTGHERYGSELLVDVLETLNSGFSIEEVFSAFNDFIVESNEEIPEKSCYSGFCLDPALETKVRLSLLLIIPGYQISYNPPEMNKRCGFNDSGFE